MTDVPCLLTPLAPAKPRRSPRTEFRDRLARCEKLLEQMKARNLENAHPITSTSASQQSSTEGPQTSQHQLIPNGRIMIDHGAVRFTEGWLCGAIFEEVLAMKSLYAAEKASHGSSPGYDLLSKSHDSINPENDMDDLEILEPLPSQMYFLWQVFLDRVHPLTKVIHAPSVQIHLVDAMCGTGYPSNDTRALLFAVFCLATLSLDDSESWSMLASPRDQAFHRFSTGLRTSLRSAHFLEFPNLTLLQALTLYLTALQGRRGSRETCVLNSACVRMAQKMGVHRDGELLGLPPFEVEMRRRIWWQIVMLDIRSSRSSGLAPFLLPLTRDCKMPTNIDDADLITDATKPFKDRNGPTEMIICLLFSKVGQLALTKPAFLEALTYRESTVFGPCSDANDQLDEFKKVAREIENQLDEVIKKFSTPSAGPIHELASTVRLALSSKISEFGITPKHAPA